MRGLIALFIWLGVPVILMNYFDIEGVLWTIFLCGVFGVVAMIYYGFTTAKEEGIPLGNPEAMNNYRQMKTLIYNSDELINNHTNIDTSSIDNACIECANGIIKNYFLHKTQGTLTKEEAGLIKLSVIEHYILNDEIIGIGEYIVRDALAEFRSLFKTKIRSEISFAARANMGLNS